MDEWQACGCASCSNSQLVKNLKAEGYAAPALGAVASEREVLPPAWYDEDRFKRGQEFFLANHFSIFVSNLSGLLAILHVAGILSVLVDTGKSSTPATAAKRYLSTLRHLYLWYTGDIFKHGDRAYKSVHLVRKIHLSVIPKDRALHTQSVSRTTQEENSASPTRESCSSVTASRSSAASATRSTGCSHEKPCSLSLEKAPSASIAQQASQVDMVATQWAFFALVLIRWKEMGIAAASLPKLGDFVHFWRTIGYLMGIEDRFNLCSSEDVSQCQIHCMALMHQLLAPAVARPSSLQQHMTSALLHGSRKIVPVIDPEDFMCYSMGLLGLEDEAAAVSKRLSAFQRFQITRRIHILSVVMHLPFIGQAHRSVFNLLMYIGMTYADVSALAVVGEAVTLLYFAVTRTMWLILAAITGVATVVRATRAAVGGCVRRAAAGVLRQVGYRVGGGERREGAISQKSL